MTIINGGGQQVGVLRSELERMNSENERLKEMLDQATNNYNGLHMHLQSLMHQHQKAAATAEEGT